MFDRAHILHHTIVVGILAVGFAISQFYLGDRNLQLATIVATGIVYAAYGIVHHRLEHDLTVKIVVEYVLVAALVVALFIFVKGGM